jgi:ArsR family transcriptional regulator
VIDANLIPLAAARFRALSDEGRLALLAVLQEGERSVGELAEATGRSQPNVSQHLSSLVHAGLVAARREGTRAFYRIVDPTVLRICEVVCGSLSAQVRERTALVRRRRRSGSAR